MKNKMKRYAPLAFAAVVLAATVGYVLFVLFNHAAASTNEHFGLVAEAYKPNASLPIDNLEGDLDVVTITSIRPATMHPTHNSATYRSEMPALLITFATPSGDDLHMTSLQYTLDGVVGNASIYNCGTVEKLVDGEWTLVGRINPNTYITHSKDDYPFIRDGHYYEIAFPLHDPGTYRLTYNFRKIARHWLFVTSDELYTLSHTVTVPEPSDRKFDVVSVNFSHSGNSAGVDLLLRTNDGENPYLYARRTNLEVLKDGRWVSAPANEPFTSAVEAYGQGLVYYSQSRREKLVLDFHHPFEGQREANYFRVDANFDVADPSAQYRLTFDFRDTPHGSGEAYPLTLYLDFSQEG